MKDFSGGAGEVAVFVAVVVGEEDPQGVDAEGGSEWGMEEGEDGEDDGNDAGPRLALGEAEADTESAGGEDGEGASGDVEKQGEEAGEGIVIMDDEVEASAEDQEQNGGDEEEASDGHPEDAESVEMAFEARLGDGADGVSEAAAATGAGLGIGLELRAAAGAEHESPPRKDTKIEGGSSGEMGGVLHQGLKPRCQY